MSGTIYLNGKHVTGNKARVSVFDYGFMYGYGLFETMPAYNNVVFRLADHLVRLDDSSRKLGITVDISEVRRALLSTVKANPFPRSRVRVAVSAGEGGALSDIKSFKEPTVVIVVSEYKPPSRSKYLRGFDVIVNPVRRYSGSVIPQMKTANAIENVLARQFARRENVDEVFFFNERNYLAEAAASNVFIVSNGELKTPRLSVGILPGVTRAIIFSLAEKRHLKVLQSNLNIDRVLAAEEIFLTNSMLEIMSVCRVSGKLIGTGKPGPVTGQLMRAYKQLVNEETAGL
jgi:branched-chain amino acid aminotransferase